MQSTSTTSPGTAPGGRPTFDQIIFMGLQSDPGKMTSWTILGSTFVAMATGKILLDTGRYFEFFHHRDNRWMQIGVTLGTIAACAHFGICIAQAWELSRHAFTDFHTIRRFESIGGNISDLIGAFLNIAASSYYAFRAYRMSGRKWWLGGFLMTFTTATFVLGTFVAIKGMTAPKVTMETIMDLKSFNEALIPLRKAWGALAMTSDGMIVVTMMFYLIRSRESVFHTEKRIYHKLVVLVLETMLPPVICILILDIDGSKASPTADFRKPVKMLIPTLFFVSLLHSLVARATIRQMLGTSLASNGMLKPNMSMNMGTSTQAGESIFVATYGEVGIGGGVGIGSEGSESKSETVTMTEMKERDLESGEYVVPIETYRPHASPISYTSNKFQNPAF